MSTLLALALVEAGHRVWLRIQGEPYDADELRAILERIVDDPDQLGGVRQGGDAGDFEQCMHPFFGFDVLGSLSQVGQDQEFFASGRGEGAYDVLILGGSVAAGFSNHGWQRLRDRLLEDPRFEGRRIRPLKYARAAFKQPQQLNVLSYLLNLGIRPDAVIDLDGFNEVTLGNVNACLGVHPLQPSVSQWATRTMSAVSDPEGLERLFQLRMLQLRVKAQARQALSSGLLWSSLLGRYWLGEVHAGERAQVGLQRAALRQLAGDHGSPVVCGPRWEGELEDVMGLCVESWATSSTAMAALCERFGAHYVHVLQPTLHDEGSKPVTQQELRTGKTAPAWREAVRVGYPQLRAAGSEFRRAGIHFLDATRVFEDVETTLYIDACHFVPEGQRMLADAIAEAFLASYE